jgi:hypothetical protein
MCCPYWCWRAAKFLTQISEYPTDPFAGLTAIDPLFLLQGDAFGIVLAIVAASRNLYERAQPPLRVGRPFASRAE